MDMKGKNEVLADRFADILMRLYSGEKLTRLTWIDEYNVTDRTFYRDINRLSPIIEKNNNGYYELTPQFRGKLNLSDLQQFSKLVGVDSLFPTKDKRFLLDLLHKLSNSSFLVKGYHYEDSSCFDAKIKTLDNIINKSSCCQFCYNSKQRLVHPYKLINSKGIWYLAGVEQDKNYSALKVFNINKLDQIFDTGDRFEPSDHITKKIIEEDGIWFSEEKVEVNLMVAPEAAYYFSRRKLFPHQKITKKMDNGYLLLSCIVSNKKQLFPLVLYWIPHVRIISPSEWNEELLEKMNNYASTLINS